MMLVHADDPPPQRRGSGGFGTEVRGGEVANWVCTGDFDALDARTTYAVERQLHALGPAFSLRNMRIRPARAERRSDPLSGVRRGK